MVAYEPVWAIGTGRAATADDAQETIAVIRATVSTWSARPPPTSSIQYGGVKSSNAEELATKPDVDGALVGGASLDADEFAMIIKGSAAAPADTLGGSRSSACPFPPVPFLPVRTAR